MRMKMRKMERKMAKKKMRNEVALLNGNSCYGHIYIRQNFKKLTLLV